VTPFGQILREAVEGTPGAVGGAFAASDGEMVDAFTLRDRDDWAILTAYYGVVLANLEAAFNTLHVGGPQYFVVEHARVDVLVQPIGHGYFALLALARPASISAGLRALGEAAAKLQKEMA
jgi:predicted regulator of Ras-like GTPase activity (Roadblock/LC7/MglB family)